MLLVFEASSSGGAPAYAHTGRRRGSPRTAPGEVGRSRPSPATSNATARRSAPTSLVSARPASADRRSRIRSPRSRRILRPALPTIPISQLTALFNEVGRLGYPRSYPSFVRAVRAAGLRPHCEPCRGVSSRATIEIEHPPGEEICVGLVRAEAGPPGRDRLRPPGHAAPLEPGPGRPRPLARPGPPRRSDRRRPAAAGRDGPRLADRSAGHGHRAGLGRRPAIVRPGRQALRRDDPALPAAPGQPQGRRRGIGPLPVRTLVADAERDHHDRGPGEPRSVLCHRRRWPARGRAIDQGLKDVPGVGTSDGHQWVLSHGH